MHIARGLIIVAALALSTAFFFFSSPNMLVLVKAEAFGWQIDVYTQKEPNSGVGPGKSSDAFAPDDLVLLYANVTYNGAGVQHVPVSFSVNGPPNPLENLTFSLTALSEDNGIAQAQFRISSPGENVETVSFGTWNVTANTDEGSDHLTFKVGWIVEITFLDLNGGIDPPQGGRLGVELSLSNLAMVAQNANLHILMYDSSDILIGSIHLENMTVDVGGTDFSTVFEIPLSARPGIGSVDVSVLTPSGAPFGPGKSGPFEISLFGDLNGNGKVDMADIAIAAAAFGSCPGHSRWNSVADVNKDHIINLWDIALIAQRFGKT
jgi:hypothetical protein